MTDDRRAPQQRSEFLEHSVYRRRRLLDAIKLLPFLGAAFFLFPALMMGGGGGSTAIHLVYYFFVWCGLIGLCAVFVRGLDDDSER
ncbi:MAG: hypothetical protein AAGA08_02085 [Pseudomonadota bacterium]